MTDDWPLAYKHSVVVPFSHEMLFGPETERPGHLEPPTAEAVDAYEAWKAKFAPLFEEGQRNSWFSPGGPDYGFKYEPPGDRWVYDDE